MAGSALDTDEYEEWMLESILLYKDLHVFELQDPSKVIEWIGEKSVCVAGYDHTKRNEILQLLVPQKLHAKEKQGLCPERDFKVEHGGFSEQPVYSLKHIPETSLLLTSGPAASPLQVWHVAAENKDVIKPISTIETDEGKETWTKIATTVSASPSVLHGSQVNCVHLTEIESTKRVYSLDSGLRLYSWNPHLQLWWLCSTYVAYIFTKWFYVIRYVPVIEHTVRPMFPVLYLQYQAQF
ncbi:hypothetical protein FKM82_009929 [Ascaphus truei]